MSQEAIKDRTKADLITIGSILNDMIIARGAAYTDKQIAEIFLKSLHGEIPDADMIHKDMKDLSFGDLRHCTLWMVKDLEHLLYTKPITVRGGLRALCTVQVYDPSAKNIIGNTHGAWITETLANCDTRFAVITRLESRRKGCGEALLTCTLRAIKGMTVYLQAGHLYKGDDEMEDQSVIDRLVKYYEAFGFVNINDQYGYQHSAIMRCPNETRITISPIGKKVHIPVV